MAAVSLSSLLALGCAGAPSGHAVGTTGSAPTVLRLGAIERDHVRDDVAIRRYFPDRPVRAEGHEVVVLGRRYVVPDLAVGSYTIEVRPAADSRLRVRPDCLGWDVDIESVGGAVHGGCDYEHDLTQRERGPLRFTVTEDDAHLRPTTGVACGEYEVSVRPGTPSCFR